MFCFLFGLLTAEANSVWLARPLLVPFLSRQLSESLPFPTPSRLLDRDNDSGEPCGPKRNKFRLNSVHPNTEHKRLSTKTTVRQIMFLIIYTISVNAKILNILITIMKVKHFHFCLTSYVVLMLGLYET